MGCQQRRENCHKQAIPLDNTGLRKQVVNAIVESFMRIEGAIPDAAPTILARCEPCGDLGEEGCMQCFPCDQRWGIWKRVLTKNLCRPLKH